MGLFLDESFECNYITLFGLYEIVRDINAGVKKSSDRGIGR